MLLWPFNKYPGTDYETFNWEWILHTVKTYTQKVDDFIKYITDTWNDFKDWTTGEIDQMHDDFANYVNVTEGALNTGAIANGAVTKVKLANNCYPYCTPEMFGAIGDGETDDTTAFIAAVNTGKLVYCENTYLVTQKVQLKKGLDGPGTIKFRSGGCFTISEGTHVKNVTFNTNNKAVEIVDTDITSADHRNVNARVIFEDIGIECETDTGPVISIASTTYGCFNFVFKNINYTGECALAVKLSSDPNVSTSWLNQVFFEDCMFASPLKVIEASYVNYILMSRCSTQKTENNKNNLLYDIDHCDQMSMLNCQDWDFTSAVKLYKFDTCKECVIMGSDRVFGNFDNTIYELSETFKVLQLAYGYQPQIYNASNVLINEMNMNSTLIFDHSKPPTMLQPTHGLIDGWSASALRITNNQAGYYGLQSFELAVMPTGELKVRLRVKDTDNQDDQGKYKTKWSDWYTFTPDA